MKHPFNETLVGVHIQWPWSRLIVEGKKCIETRGYPLPSKYERKPLAIIETPGKNGRKEAGIVEARIIGIVIFRNSFRYKSKADWIEDFGRHLVRKNDASFSFESTSEKWGWEIEDVYLLPKPVAPPKKRGIVFANGCRI